MLLAALVTAQECVYRKKSGERRMEEHWEKILLHSIRRQLQNDIIMKVEEIKDKIEPVLIRHKIKRAGIFGSIVKGAASADSDIDILVELGNKISLLEFVGIKYELEDLLGRKVDLVEYDAIKPRLKDKIMSEEVRIYG